MMPTPKPFNPFAALLVALMLTALVLVVNVTVQRFVPQWQPGYLTGACLLVALETAFVTLTVRRERMWANESVRYLAAEVALLLVLMRVVATLSLGAATLGEDVQIWLRYPLSAVTDIPFMGCFLLGICVALAANRATHDLLDLAPQQFEGVVRPSDEHLRVHTLASYDRADALRRINRRFIFGGVVLLLALGLQVVNITSITGPPLAVSPWAAGAALAYLIVGFLLYSQARLALLQSRWTMEHAAVETGVTRRWTRSSLLLVGGLSLLMLLLPRTYGMGLLDTLRAAAAFALALIVQLGYILLWVVSLATMLPLLLFSWLLPAPDAQAPPLPPPPPPVVPPPIAEQPGVPPLLPSLIFWACMLFLAGYACWTVLQRHPGLLNALLLRGPLAAIRRWLVDTWHDSAAWAQHAADVVARRLSRPARPPRPSWPALRLGKLAPRDLVRYFYRSTLQRAAQQGVARKVGQTPYEYGTTLAHLLPDSQEDVTQLTDAFVQAQYSPQPPTAPDAQRVRHYWERLRQRLVRARTANKAHLPRNSDDHG